MASFGWLHDFVNPIAATMRSMPITAFLPAFIALFGMDETEKVSFLYFGMFFYLLAVVVEEVRRVDESLLETAYTLGASRAQVLWLMFRASFPSIFSSFKILYDIGWIFRVNASLGSRVVLFLPLPLAGEGRGGGILNYELGLADRAPTRRARRGDLPQAGEVGKAKV